MKKWIVSIILLSFVISSFAAQDFYLFNSHEDQARFNQLISELRCVVCQNQTISESNAGLASDLREQIFKKIQQGQSNQDIIRYLTDRYGDFILYQPPLNLKTLLLWFSPFVVLIFGSGYLFFYIRQRKHVTSV